MQKKYSEIIQSENSLFSLDIQEVWRYKDLLYMFVKRDFVTFYKQTILGPLWFLIQPILTTMMFMLVFNKLAKISTDGMPPIAFYLCGTVIWAYFSESLTKVSTVFNDNAHVFGKVYFPRLIMPLSIVASGLLKFGVQFFVFLLVVLYYTFIDTKLTPNFYVLLTPFLVLLMALLALGLGMIFSSLTNKYKDLVFLLSFGIQLFMYITPVIYPISFASENIQNFMVFNPLTGIVECFRYAFLGTGGFESYMLVYSAIISVSIFLIGTYIFNYIEKSFMDSV
jgi:lipopolysaccharide transport system permease protein